VEARHLAAHRVLLTPQGAPLTQSKVLELARLERLTLICGRYEGFDDRVRSYVHDELSLGDYVLTGGEVPAMAVIEAVVRLLPGVLGNEASTSEESFSPDHGGLLEYPQYTRPSVFRGVEVPAVLRGGDHGEIARWRRDQALQRTRVRRPDLLPRGGTERPLQAKAEGRDRNGGS
jgi:tRNA (guanine37-N1)-methyltransferase